MTPVQWIMLAQILIKLLNKAETTDVEAIEASVVAVVGKSENETVKAVKDSGIITDILRLFK